MNEIFKELWNLNIKQTFLLIAFIVELLFLTYAFLVYCYEKNETLKLITFIKKNIFLSILLLTIPAVLLLLVFILKDTFSLDGWLSFLGGYFGVIGAITGIWWQLNEGKKRILLASLKIFKYYFKQIIGENKENLSGDFFLISKKYLNIYRGGIHFNEEFILHDNKIEILYENSHNILFSIIGEEIIDIIDLLQSLNSYGTDMIKNSLEIRAMLRSCKDELSKDSIFQNLIKSSTYDNIETHEDLKNLKNDFNILIKQNISYEACCNLINCVSQIERIERLLFKPGLKKLEEKIITILPKIDDEIKKLS